MKLYCAGGIVLATHDDAQDVPALAYGEGVTIVHRAEGLVGLDRIGQPPPDGIHDHRPYAAPEVTLAVAQAAARTKIDIEAERQRLRWITPGTGQAMTYARKVEEAHRLGGAPDPQAEAFPMLAASIGIDGPDLAAVAATVLAMDAAWGRIGGAIEARRLGLKRDVDQAATSADLALIDITTGWPE